MSETPDRIASPLRRLDALRLDNRFARLGEAYFSRVTPTPLTNPRLLHANAEVAALLDLDPAAVGEPLFSSTARPSAKRE